MSEKPNNLSQWSLRITRKGKRKGKYMKKSSFKTTERCRLRRLAEKNILQTKDEPTNKVLWQGRESFHTTTFSKQMWCNNCNPKVALSLDFATSRIKKGTGNEYYIVCHQCGKGKSVCTDKAFGPRGEYIAGNAKLAMGMMDAGIGETEINLVFSAANYEPISSSILKRHERLIGPIIEELAKESCSKALEKEVELTIEASDVVTDENQPGKIGCSFSFDYGWQKKGSGKSYNSQSGHGVLMKYRGKKICSYSTRIKNCRKCNAGQSKGSHDCRCNFEGSAKAMEADAAVEMYTQNPLFEKHNVFGARLIMDNDSTIPANVRAASTHNIELWSDKNHCIKAFNNHLYSIKLSKPLIDYFANGLSGRIEEYKHQPEELAASHKTMVPHAFGDHSQCFFHENKENYEYKTLPGKKALDSPQLRTFLEELVDKFVNNVDKIAPGASTQGNESFNNLVASKCPKSKHYSGSESLDFRVACAVNQKNEGYDYINEVYEKMNLSPVCSGSKFRNIKNNKLQAKRLFQTTRSFKIKRKRLRQKRSEKGSKGITYESDIGLSGVLDVAVEAIPFIPAVDETNAIENCKIVYFDIETTGLSKNDQIVQIAAYDGEEVYNAFSVPSICIKPAASQVTGFTVKKGELFIRKEKIMNTVSKTLLLEEFLNYLEKISNPSQKVILVGHNVLRFDGPRLEALARDLGIYERFISLV